MNPAPPRSSTIRTIQPILAWSIGFAILLAVGWVDLITGYEIHLPALYFAPVALLAWNVGLRSGLAMVVFATITWFLADRGAGHPYASWYDGYLNALMEMLAYSVVAYSVARVRRELTIEKGLNAELSHALAEIKRLEGLLPICASCKRIRQEDNTWEQIEIFVTKRTDAKFTHGLCPECANALFPGISTEINVASQPSQSSPV
ncbi:MAG: hypothetical protein WDN28_27210 [Chthoniobacter sp.]